MAGDSSGPDPWPEIRREPVADCRVFSVERSIATSPIDGEPHTFHRIHSPTWAQILPITADGHAVLVKQYRHGCQRVTLEMPAGLVDPGEDPAVAAMRECLEETGYRAREVRSLGVVNPNPALFANKMFSYYATDVELERAVANTSTERTEPCLVRVNDLRRMLETGEIDHGLVAAALWRYLYLHADRR